MGKHWAQRHAQGSVFFSAPWSQCGTACGDRALAGPGGRRYGETAVGFLLGPLALAFPDLCFCSLLLECPLWKGANMMRRMHIVGETHTVPRVHQLARTWHKRAASYVLFLYSARVGPFLPTGLPPGAFLMDARKGYFVAGAVRGEGTAVLAQPWHSSAWPPFGPRSRLHQQESGLSGCPVTCERGLMVVISQCPARK